ncbi:MULTISPECIES: aldolase/citrate lyase family protein [unclassified Brevibacillus]|uniref:aldolase/citrate lyase family protein n=1 Tax=unclassified Brevibacillus TaxID=2684853 RepID=UPI0035625181
MIKLMLITNDPFMAKTAIDSGVNRIFVDLEINGKEKRQGHLNTVISRHSIEDVKRIRKAVPYAELLVRINPLFDGSQDEVNEVMNAGADIIMLPMFYHWKEVETLVQMVNGRAKVIPLIETPPAMIRIAEIVKVNGLEEVYIGLNDLHLSLDIDFMFEPLATGLIDYMVSTIKEAGLSFGFGGIARMGEGVIPGELLLGEHVRLGASSVILSRSFHGNAKSYEELKSNIDIKTEILKLRQMESQLQLRSDKMIKNDQQKVKEIILSISKDLWKRKVVKSDEATIRPYS